MSPLAVIQFIKSSNNDNNSFHKIARTACGIETVSKQVMHNVRKRDQRRMIL